MPDEATDQRGEFRPQDGTADGVPRCDMGAFEKGSGSNLDGIRPDRGGNVGSICASVYGHGFAAGDSVKLTRAGEPDIVGQPVKIVARGRILSTEFDLTARTRELSVFLAEFGGEQAINAHFSGRVAIHDSCSSRRELGIHAAPRALLRKLAGVEPVELKEAEACCGFGGTFCVKYPDISARMVSDKAAAVIASGAEVLVFPATSAV